MSTGPPVSTGAGKCVDGYAAVLERLRQFDSRPLIMGGVKLSVIAGKSSTGCDNIYYLDTPQLIRRAKTASLCCKICIKANVSLKDSLVKLHDERISNASKHMKGCHPEVALPSPQNILSAKLSLSLLTTSPIAMQKVVGISKTESLDAVHRQVRAILVEIGLPMYLFDHPRLSQLITRLPKNQYKELRGTSRNFF